jgi:hypothetical protein
VHAAGPRQRSLSPVRYLQPHFTVSDLRRLFSSPPTTRRVTVDVFDLASTRVGRHADESFVIHLRHGSTETTAYIFVCPLERVY